MKQDTDTTHVSVTVPEEALPAVYRAVADFYEGRDEITTSPYAEELPTEADQDRAEIEAVEAAAAEERESEVAAEEQQPRRISGIGIRSLDEVPLSELRRHFSPQRKSVQWEFDDPYDAVLHILGDGTPRTVDQIWTQQKLLRLDGRLRRRNSTKHALVEQLRRMKRDGLLASPKRGVYEIR